MNRNTSPHRFLRLPLIAFLVLGWTCHPVMAAPPAGVFGLALDAFEHPLEGPVPSPYSQLPLTVECWVKLNSRDGYNILVANHAKTSDDHWELYTEAGTGNFAVYLPRFSSPVIASASNIADGEWRHVAAILETARVRLFVDGEPVVDHFGPETFDRLHGTGPLTVGFTSDGASRLFCDGLIDEVRITEGVIDFVERPESPFELDDNTIGLWRFDEDDRNRFADESKTGYHLAPIVKKRKVERLGQEVVDIDDQDESDWEDDRWPLMDTGPFFSATIATPQIPGARPTYKGIALRLGARKDRTVLFDTELLRYTAGWSGGFVKTSPKRLGIIDTPHAAGDIQFKTNPTPGVSPDGEFVDPRLSPFGPMPKVRGRYRGLHRYGERVVLSYTVGETPILESPWIDAADNLTAFNRTLSVGSASTTLSILLCDEEAEGRIVEIEGASVAVLPTADGLLAVGLARGSAEEFHLRTEGGRIILDAEPREANRSVKVLIARCAESDLPRFVDLLAATSAPEDLSAWTRGGPSLWVDSGVVSGVVNRDAAPYVIDTIPVPYENPYNALMYTSGLDFLRNGDLAVCTVHGDVWLVKGIDEKLENIVWQRYATGLFQPLGLRVRDGEIFVLGRDQITRLKDLNGDDEADAYECFNNDVEIADGGHSYATCLETDPAGNFYFSKGADSVRTAHDGCVLKVSADGANLSVLATGFRFPNGMYVLEEDLVSIADQEGNWVPASRIDFAGPGFFSGYIPTHHRDAEPETFDPPMCWLPQDIDNSSGGQVRGEGDDWGPLSNHLIHLSYGHCMMLYCLTEQVEGVWQGGAVRLPLQFLSGVMRGRFGPDGQLYLCGLRGWQTSAVRDGCLQRVRYTGAPFHGPIELNVHENGIRIVFPEPLDEEFAVDPESYAVDRWNYRWRQEYGSDDWSVENPDTQGRDDLEVERAHLIEEGRAIFLEIPDLRPAMQMRIRYNLDSAEGDLVKGTIHHTIHRLGDAYPLDAPELETP